MFDFADVGSGRALGDLQNSYPPFLAVEFEPYRCGPNAITVVDDDSGFCGIRGDTHCAYSPNPDTRGSRPRGARSEGGGLKRNWFLGCSGKLVEELRSQPTSQLSDWAAAP